MGKLQIGLQELGIIPVISRPAHVFIEKFVFIPNPARRLIGCLRKSKHAFTQKRCPAGEWGLFKNQNAPETIHGAADRGHQSRYAGTNDDEIPGLGPKPV